MKVSRGLVLATMLAWSKEGGRKPKFLIKQTLMIGKQTSAKDTQV
jgi:hypothetical protein